jgi:hypothetical protein
MVDIDETKGAGGHVRRLRVIRILDDGCPAISLDGLQASGTVIEHAGENHPDCVGSVGQRSRAKERIDRRPCVVLFRAAAQLQPLVKQENMMIRRGDIDPPWFDALPVSGVCRPQRSHLTQDLGQVAPVRADVKNNDQRRWEIFGEPLSQGGERLTPPVDAPITIIWVICSPLAHGRWQLVSPSGRSPCILEWRAPGTRRQWHSELRR